MELKRSGGKIDKLDALNYSFVILTGVRYAKADNFIKQGGKFYTSLLAAEEIGSWLSSPLVTQVPDQISMLVKNNNRNFNHNKIIKCFKCDSIGHISHFCENWSNQSRINSNRNGNFNSNFNGNRSRFNKNLIKCFKCHRMVHYSRDYRSSAASTLVGGVVVDDGNSSKYVAFMYLSGSWVIFL